MKNKGIDQFRVIAAMMVVAIHCLPLHYLWPEGDILITLTIFRVAVPFFFYDQWLLCVCRTCCGQ